MKMIAHGFEHSWSCVQSATDERVIRNYFGRFLSGRQALALLMSWFDRSESRRHLARLDERMLKDIGLTAADVDHETRKSFWQQ